MTEVAILGAGIAGLAAAYEMRGHGIGATVFESTAHIGGRVSTVERGPVLFDDGAQFIRTETAAAERLLLHDLPGDALFDLRREVRPFDGRGRIGPGDPAQNALPKWGYRGGLRVLPQLLAAASKASVHLGWPVARIVRSATGWDVVGPRGTEGGFGAVLVTLPPAAATALLSRTDGAARSVEGLRGAHHRTIISVAFEPESPLQAPEHTYALVNADRKHPISWLAFESAKPGHVPAGREVIVAQMAHEWSAPRLALRDGAIAAEAVTLSSALIGTDLAPRWAHVTRWPEALPDATVPIPRSDEKAGLFFAGDVFVGGRVHLALESGLAAAAQIQRQLDAQS
ncbi:MAG: FAD-dependent oxidoreductase [Dehalococcoidia bacterium]